jgi:ABC-type nitrate/sulfonate/bicarbonate transport system substrate-binding protein
VKIIGGGPSASRIAAMGANQVQISVDSNPGNIEMAGKGYHQLATEGQFTKTYPDHVVFAKTSYINSNGATLSKLLTAIAAGMKLEKSNPKLAQQSMVSNVKIDSKYAPATYHGFIDQQFPDGRLPDAQAMNTFWQIGIQNGEFKSKLPESKWLDTKWIDSYPNFPK